jgi:hypothetical protein
MSDGYCITAADIKELKTLLRSFKQNLAIWIDYRRPGGSSGIESRMSAGFSFVVHTEDTIEFPPDVNIDELVENTMGT